MNRIQKLDYLLKMISEHDKFIGSMDIYKNTQETIDKIELTPMIDKLLLDGFITKKFINNENESKLIPPYYCRITYSGLIFMENGGYKIKRVKSDWNYFWKKGKTIANILNSILILIIATIGVYLTWETKAKDTSLSTNQVTIDSLKTELKQIYTVDNIVWGKFKNGIKNKELTYLLNNSLDSIKCTDCVVGKNEKHISSELIFKKYLDRLYDYELLKNKVYSLYENDSIIRVNYSFEKLIGAESSNIIYTFNKIDEKFLFTGMITTP